MAHLLLRLHSALLLSQKGTFLRLNLRGQIIVRSAIGTSIEACALEKCLHGGDAFVGDRGLRGSVALTAVGQNLARSAAGSGGEIEEFVDETHFACDPWFEQDAMAASEALLH